MLDRTMRQRNFLIPALDFIKVSGVPSPTDNTSRREVPMPSDEEVTQRAGSLRAMTGLTDPEFQALLPWFERAFERAMATRTIDGQPRTSRRYRAYVNGPLPTMADKLLFMLSYVKHHPLQELQGQLFGRSQSNANKWIHLLHAALNQALAAQDLLPARTADELVALLARHKTEATSPSPLVGTTGRSDRSHVRKIQKSRKNTTVARGSVTRAKTSC
jgi:Helix-turn-helix of DDE superfamily endonuclease